MKGGVAGCVHAKTCIAVDLYSGATPNDGVPDMTVISEIDEYGINTNLKVRYKQGRIYVSVSIVVRSTIDSRGADKPEINLDVLFFNSDLHWYHSRGCQSLPPAGYI